MYICAYLKKKKEKGYNKKTTKLNKKYSDIVSLRLFYFKIKEIYFVFRWNGTSLILCKQICTAENYVLKASMKMSLKFSDTLK